MRASTAYFAGAGTVIIAMVAGMGGSLGVLCGVASTLAIDALGASETVLSWPAAALGLLCSLGAGILFGIYPALRAAHLEPIQALRET